jgi:hypothetical protein
LQQPVAQAPARHREAGAGARACAILACAGEGNTTCRWFSSASACGRTGGGYFGAATPWDIVRAVDTLAPRLVVLSATLPACLRLSSEIAGSQTACLLPRRAAVDATVAPRCGATC